MRWHPPQAQFLRCNDEEESNYQQTFSSIAASRLVLMASASDQVDLLFTQSLLKDANVSYLKELAVADNPQVE